MGQRGDSDPDDTSGKKTTLSGGFFLRGRQCVFYRGGILSRSDVLSPAAPFLSAAEEMGAAARWGQRISPEKSCSQNVYTFGQRKSKITIDKSAKRAILWSRSKKGKVKIDFAERWKASMGISDLIAGFIQQELDEAGGALELQRSDLAQRFNCVPSQINYVMSTRFSPEHGYIVESRRGGGGYIRITRVPGGPADAADARYQHHRRYAGLRQCPGHHPESGGLRGHQPVSWASPCWLPPVSGPAQRRQGAAQRTAGPIFSNRS